MDPISISASVVSFVALALQLADNVQKLYDFWLSVGIATEDVQGILDDLHLLGCILSQIAHDMPSGFHGSETPPSCFRILRRCEDNVSKLRNTMDEVQLEFSRGGIRRRWMAVKFVAKKPQIERFHLILERTKTTLMIELLQLNWCIPSPLDSIIKCTYFFKLPEYRALCKPPEIHLKYGLRSNRYTFACSTSVSFKRSNSLYIQRPQNLRSKSYGRTARVPVIGSISPITPQISN